MAAIEEDEIKILSQIRAMEDGEMKSRLTEAFMDQLKSSSSRNSGKKPLFVDASFERNTRSFQRHQEKPDKVRSLTLGEVSREIHNIKSEISTLKSQIAEIKKGKQAIEENSHSWDTTEYAKNLNPNLEIVEGKKDPVFGFQEMRILAVSYQQHHVKVNICIKGEMFELTTLLDS